MLAIPQVGVVASVAGPGAEAGAEAGAGAVGGAGAVAVAVAEAALVSGTETTAVAPNPMIVPVPAPPVAAPEPPKPVGPCLVVYQNRAPVFRHFVVNDETLIGRADPIAGSFPDLDVAKFDPDRVASRKHAFVYRQEGKHVLHALSDGGTQLNQELLKGGDRREIKEGDVIVLGAKIALKFEVVR
ncbi:MAG: FHA domain-containing protein [Deltaproteobacteria bacterium]|nr:FHA domain-containing protein [Deltaproteobacteria bacterium]